MVGVSEEGDKFLDAKERRFDFPLASPSKIYDTYSML